MEKNLIEKLNEMHEQEKHKEIIDIINNLAAENLNNEILGKLARAYNNNNEPAKALEILKTLENEENNTALWNYRIGHTYFALALSEKNREYLENAITFITKALELNPDEPDCKYLLYASYYNLAESFRDENSEKSLELFLTSLKYAEEFEEITDCERSIAWTYNHMSKYDLAYEYLEKLFEKSVNDAWTHSEAGFSLVNLGRAEEALIHFEKARELGRDDSWIKMQFGYAYNELNETKKALNSYLSVLEDEEEQNNIWLLSQIGWTYDFEGEFAKALEYLLKAHELGRNDVWIYSELGFCYSRLDDFDSAISFFEKAHELGRDDEWLNIEFLYSYNRKREFNKSLEYLEKIKDTEGNIGLLSEIGYTLARTGKGEEAIKYYLKAEELGRNDEWLYSEIGWTYDDIENFEEGYKYLLKAEELGRNDEWLNTEIGQCLGRMGKFEEGIERLKKSLTMDDVDDRAWLHSEIGYLYGRLSQDGEAYKHLKEAYDLGRNDIWINSELSFNQTGLGNYEEAIKFAKKAIELGRNDEWIHNQIGFSYQKSEKYKEAIEHFKIANEKLPYDDWNLINLGKTLRKNGDITEALEYLKQVNTYEGWIDLELAWCYVLLDDKENTNLHLENIKKFLATELETDLDLKNDVDAIKKLLNSITYMN